MFVRRLLNFVLAIGLAFSPLTASAQDLNWRLFEFVKLTGGLNDTFNSLDIADNEASDLQNIIFPRSQNGAFGQRPGFTRINSTAVSGTPAFNGMTFFKLTDGTRYLVSVLDDDTVRKMDYGVGAGPDGTWDDITGSISFSADSNDQADFVVAENTLIIEDGIATTAPYQWTGSGNITALGGSPPSAQFVEYHNRILFVAGDSSNPSRLTFSNLDAITTWTSTDFILIETDSSDGVIRGIKSGLDGLYIWKDRAIWRLSGTGRDDFRLERMVQGIGAASNSSIAIINSPADSEQLFVFVTNRGDVAIYDGGVDVNYISRKITNSVPNSLAFDRVDEAVATAYEFTYIVSLTNTGGSTHDRLYMFDFLHNAWTRFVGMDANAISTFEAGDTQELLMFGDYAGFSNQWDITDTTADNDPGTTAIDAFYTTGWLGFDNIGAVEKRLRVIRVFANQEGTGQTLDLEVRADFASAGTTFSISLAGAGAVWGSAVWGVDRYSGLSVTIDRIEPNAGDNLFQLRFRNNRVNESFTIRKFQMILEPSGRV